MDPSSLQETHPRHPNLSDVTHTDAVTAPDRPCRHTTSISTRPTPIANQKLTTMSKDARATATIPPSSPKPCTYS
ncbi:uncharacterized protein K452DRAFT_292018 [Aplosporella prunicola CBS 121167]|uniref:Uncharacterized protein n=1 Tax=Aplosporella prunicola CBS 121167 TaxID=1176127 RepID=A0A6A6B0U7_9PEZI|nr:uncharacterized protein K452DRAFT_292018 [Aplosporella prunicola CBS 121167]KAF2136875.1 hypothetical protein K452DRAFT_292018 [Aplosporella prunicola CBS 121167]